MTVPRPGLWGRSSPGTLPAGWGPGSFPVRRMAPPPPFFHSPRLLSFHPSTLPSHAATFSAFVSGLCADLSIPPVADPCRRLRLSSQKPWSRPISLAATPASLVGDQTPALARPFVMGRSTMYASVRAVLFLDLRCRWTC